MDHKAKVIKIMAGFHSFTHSSFEKSLLSVYYGPDTVLSWGTVMNESDTAKYQMMWGAGSGVQNCLGWKTSSTTY